METRVCQRCGLTKATEDFYQYKNNKTCRLCWANRKRTWDIRVDPNTGRTNRQISSAKTWLKYSNEQKRHREKLRYTVIEHYSNGTMACACCKEDTYQFLAIDHIIPVGRKPKDGSPRSSAVLYRWLIRNGFPNGYRILCHNCNVGRQINGGTCPHEEVTNAKAS